MQALLWSLCHTKWLTVIFLFFLDKVHHCDHWLLFFFARSLLLNDAIWSVPLFSFSSKYFFYLGIFLYLLCPAQDHRTMNAHKMAKLDMTLRHFPHINGMCYGRGAIKLTEVTVSDKLEGFRASKEVFPPNTFGKKFLLHQTKLKV